MAIQEVTKNAQQSWDPTHTAVQPLSSDNLNDTWFSDILGKKDTLISFRRVYKFKIMLRDSGNEHVYIWLAPIISGKSKCHRHTKSYIGLKLAEKFSWKLFLVQFIHIRASSNKMTFLHQQLLCSCVVQHGVLNTQHMFVFETSQSQLCPFFSFSWAQHSLYY